MGTPLAAVPLQTLNLSECSVNCIKQSQPEGIHEFASDVLSGCSDITDAGFAHLVNNLSALSLQTLNLYNCSEITDEGLAQLTALFLQMLNLSECSGTRNCALSLQPYCLGVLSSRVWAWFISLQTLNLSDCSEITDADLDLK